MSSTGAKRPSIYSGGVLIDGRGNPGKRVYSGGVLLEGAARGAREYDGGILKEGIPCISVTHSNQNFASIWKGASGSIFVDWGDGSAVEEFVLVSGGVDVDHTYGGAGTYEIKVTGATANVIDLAATSQSISAIAGFDQLPGLLSLAMSGNALTDISTLANCTSLQILNVGSNQIADISVLSGLTDLQSIRVYYNQISDISPLVGLSNATLIYAFNNALTYTTQSWFTATSGNFRFYTTLSTAAEVDQFLIDLNNASWANCTVHLNGTNPAHTGGAPVLAAIAGLVSRSVTLHLN